MKTLWKKVNPIHRMLERAGWKRVESYKNGCFKHVLWMDPHTSLVHEQARAVDTVRYRRACIRDAKKLVLVRVSVPSTGDPEGPA